MKIAELVHEPSFGITLSIHMNIYKFHTFVFAVSRRQNFGHILKKSNGKRNLLLFITRKR